MDKTLVSVVMSTYLEPLPYVAEAVSSILNQTYSNLEFLIHVDDKNNQPVLDYLQTLEKKDGRVRVFVHDEPQGLAVCRNAGIQLATGEYIALMDADDIAVESRIEKQLKYIEQNPTDLLFTYMEYIDESGKSNGNFFTPSLPRRSKILTKLLTQPLFGHPTALIKRGVFGELQYDPTFKKGQDTDLWIRCLMEGYKFAILPEPLLLCRLHRAGTDFKERLDRQQGYAKFGMRIIGKHYKNLWYFPTFWWYVSKRVFYYGLLYLVPQGVLLKIMRSRDRLRIT